MAEQYVLFDELEDVLGIDQAHQLVKNYAGSTLYIPKRPLLIQKHEKIRKEFSEGAGYRELARRYAYSERNIRYIVHKKQAKKSQ
jgi:Mor family transcriptional regulator